MVEDTGRRTASPDADEDYPAADRRVTPGRQRTGRRRGGPDTRAQILEAARDSFARNGYAGTTVRAVAAAAGVDSALLFHFFSSKNGLFAAALALPIDPAALLGELLVEPRDTLAERITRRYLELWEDPATGEPLRAMVRSATASEQDGNLLREFLHSQILAQLAAALDVDRRDERIGMVSAQLMGVAFARYVVRAHPLASLPVDEAVAWVSPSVHHYLFGQPTPFPRARAGAR